MWLDSRCWKAGRFHSGTGAAEVRAVCYSRRNKQEGDRNTGDEYGDARAEDCGSRRGGARIAAALVMARIDVSAEGVMRYGGMGV
jgi:hypothetical protein